MLRTHRRFTRRLWAALIVAIVSTITFTGAVAAAPSTHIEEHFVKVAGVDLAAPGARAYIDAVHSTLLGSDAGFQLWIEPELPWTGPPTYTSGRADLAVGAGDSSLSGTFDLIDREGAVVGIGVLDASLTSIGDIEEVKWPKTNGNAKHRESQVYQPMIVGGSVTATIGNEQIVLSLEGAANGFAADFTAFKNAPAATLDWRTFTALGFVATRGDIAFQVAMHDEGGLALSEAVVQLGDQTFVGFDDGDDTTFSGGRYGLELALQSSGGNGIADATATGGTITGSATIVPAERLTWSEDLGGAVLRIAVQKYTLSGSFTVSFDDGTIQTFSVDNRIGYAEQVTYRLFQPAD